MTKENTHAGHLQPRVSSTRCRLRSSTLPNRPLPVRDTISTTDCTLNLKPSSPRSSSPSALRAHRRLFPFESQIYLGNLYYVVTSIPTRTYTQLPRATPPPLPARAPRATHTTTTLSRLPAATSPPAPRLAATLVTADADRPALGPPTSLTRPPPPILLEACTPPSGGRTFISITRNRLTSRARINGRKILESFDILIQGR